MCWGQGVSTGALGVGPDAGSMLPQRVVGLSDVVGVALGSNHSCALTGSGSARCWGASTFGEVGNGSTQPSYSPQVTLASGVAGLSMGARHGCALMVDAGVLCWGTNIIGQQGTGSTAQSVRFPTPMNLSVQASVVFAFDEVSAVLARGDDQLWFSGLFGNILTPTPRREALFDGGVSFIVGSANHACMINARSELWCVGSGAQGQLGYPLGNSMPQPLRPVPDIGPVKDVCTGLGFTCAVIVDGGVRCFGEGSFGQLGSGAFGSSPAPLPVLSLPPATQVGCRYRTACAATTQGIWCWGDNAQGQLGAATPMSSALPLSVAMPN